MDAFSGYVNQLLTPGQSSASAEWIAATVGGPESFSPFGRYVAGDMPPMTCALLGWRLGRGFGHLLLRYSMEWS